MISQIQHENRKRLKLLFDEYDPVYGIGSPLDRFALRINGIDIWLPLSMAKEEIVLLLRKKKLKKDKLELALRALDDVRIRHDFEFWAYKYARIQDKLSKQIIPFRLNKPQRKILLALEAQRIANKPIRIDLLKARQYGGSTLVQMYFAWVQCVLKENWHSVIVADVEDQTKNIRAMYKRFVDKYSLQSLSLAPYEGSTKNKILIERGSIMCIGSMQKPDSLRSTDNAMIHMSEVGLWKKTDGKSPEDLVQNLIASVPDVPLSIIVRESTAKGVGNYWHRTYNSTDGYAKVFVGWHEVEIYQKELPMPEVKFFETLNEYEKHLWDIGATLEGIFWHRCKLQEIGGDTWRMCSEFPSTELEAFQSTGRRFYPPSYIKQARIFVCKHSFQGDIFACESTGKGALQDIRIEPTPNGELKIWKQPESGYKNRYIVSVDIGGRSAGADYSTINVFDRSEIVSGGALDRAALWRGHIDQDLLSWKSAQISKFYCNALLVIEINSLDKEEIEGTEGVNYLTVIDEIVPFYPNIYAINEADKLRQGIPIRYGFHMNRATKPLVMNAKKAAMRDLEFIDYSVEAVDEADVMEIRNNGSISAVEGAHDDIEVPTATAIYVSSAMQAPSIIIKTPRSAKSNNISEASF